MVDHYRPTCEVKLLPHQWEAWNATEPYVAMVTGLGGGKTYTLVRWILARAIEYPESIHMITANSYPQLRDVVVPELLAACEEWGLSYRWLKGDHNLYLIGKGGVEATVRARSCNAGSVDEVMRGVTLGSWAGDEVRDMAAYAVQVIIGRGRCKKVDRFRYLWGTTPNGFDHVWERHVENDDDRCRLIQARTDDNPHLPEDYVVGLRRDYDEQMALQETEGKFVSLGAGCCYRSFDRATHVRDLEYNPGLPLTLCVDFNVDPMGWVVAQEAGGGEIHVLGEVFVRNAGISDAVEALANDWGAHPGEWHVYGDPTGQSRTAQTGRTHYAVLMDSLQVHGICGAKLSQSSKIIPVKDRINTVNSLLRNAEGRHRLFIDDSCVQLRKDFEQVVWDKAGAKEDQPSGTMRTHVSSALGYWLYQAHRPSSFRSEPGYRMNGVTRGNRLRTRYANA